MTPTRQTCTRCGKCKPLDDYYVVNGKHLHHCKECHKTAVKVTGLARGRALQRLAKLHPEEFADLVAEERDKIDTNEGARK